MRLLLALILSTMSFIISPSLWAGNCKSPLSDREAQAWQNRLGQDPQSFLNDQLQFLHQSLSSKLNDWDPTLRNRLLIHFRSGFDVETWGQNLPSSLQQNEETQNLGYFYLVHRYLGALRRSALQNETAEFTQRARNLSERQREDVLDFPVKPQITEISRFLCATSLERKNYPCEKNLFLITVQLSPKLLCSPHLSSQLFEASYLIVQDQDPLLLDIKMHGSWLLSTHLEQLKALEKNLAADQLTEALNQVTYTQPGDLQ